ncbi:hexosaminidase [Cognatiyoonia sediminum]|uniref:beta-N-acetylhexosaminidase n=1 Tax=Cognatiyoonia sediminum TaxID=1508389 RepID=A0A1M5T4Z1_9RHOB|nr:beta-N-acetylhexosaminidase [Cognatiyoonia sediminum]SHH45660.1 hexosaminidase [Cognatiyoonia sediminum]
MKYDCQIVGDELLCAITSDQDLAAPVFCFSGMAPLEPVRGGTLIKSVGSYTEVQLPDLAKGKEHKATIKYQAGYKPANRAWKPLGPYLRVGGDIIELPPTEAGRRVPPRTEHSELEGLPLAPQPETWAPSEGVLEADGFAFEDDALSAVSALAQRQGMLFKGTMPIIIETGELETDAYEIEFTPQGVRIIANSYGGRFYAGITLLTLLQQGPIPCGRITDSPRFAWRGQHLDTARHYYEPDTILSLLDLMAILKLNRFHWHFADDEAFRLEVACLPDLWQKTALRGDGQTMPGLFSGAPVQGGSYSIETAKQIIARAKELNIEILPEIETPAHALCITTLYPETLDSTDNGAERSVQGYERNAMNPAMPKTWDIVEALITEIAEIFPFGHIHLGCDELAEDTWMSSPKARALMEQHDLQTTMDLQGWTMYRFAAFARSKSLRPAAWEEAAQGKNGGIGHDAILFSWTGQGPGLEAARAGYDVVMTPAQQVYLDMAHTSDPDDWGASWAAFVDLPDTINWDPVPDADLSDRIIGVQGTFWSEFTTQDDQIWPMLMPRMLGVAAMCWERDKPSIETVAALAGYYSVSSSGEIEISAT